MLPLRPSDELFLQISSNPRQLHNIPRDMVLANPPASVDHKYNSTTRNLGRASTGRPELAISGNGEMPKDDGNYKKKMIHRDNERQRRQEMSTLHATLRSLLPIEFIKGKRSMSDHMNEAVNYIKHLRRKIKEKGAMRDELKEASDLGVLASQNESSSSISSSNSVMVRPCLGGIEIVFDSGLKEEGLHLSKVLKALLDEEGIFVANCVSTRVNDKLFHTVQAEVNDPGCLNLAELQRKLNSSVPASD